MPTIIPYLKDRTQKKITAYSVYIYGVGNPGPGIGQALKCGWG
jgi:hypothetical protein